MNSSDADVLDAFRRRRDESSFRRLYRFHTPAVYAMALRVCGSESDAEDLAQEAWCRAIEKFDSYRGDSAFRTWLISILINCYREMLRRRRTRHENGRDPGKLVGDNVTHLAVGRSTSASIVDTERALGQLPGGYREVVLLHDLYGYTHKEIAMMLDIAEGTSKSQLTRGRQKLRELLTTVSAKSADNG